MDLSGSRNKHPLNLKRLSNTDHSDASKGSKPRVQRKHINVSEYLRENHETPQLALDPLPSGLPLQGERGSSHSSTELSSSEAVWLVRKWKENERK